MNPDETPAVEEVTGIRHAIAVVDQLLDGLRTLSGKFPSRNLSLAITDMENSRFRLKEIGNNHTFDNPKEGGNEQD